MSRTLVLSSGGLTGIAWETGVLHGLASCGIDVDDWDRVIGLSAGAYVGAHLRSHGHVAALYAAQLDVVPGAELRALGQATSGLLVTMVRASRQPTLARVGVIPLALRLLIGRALRHGPSEFTALRKIASARRHGADPLEAARTMGSFARMNQQPESTWVDYWGGHFAVPAAWPEGALEIVGLDVDDGSCVSLSKESGAPLHLAVSASTAIPGLVPAITVEGRLLMDGGGGSPTKAHLAVGATEVLVLAASDRGGLAAEVEELRATGTRVHVILPSEPARATIGEDLARLDPRRIRQAAEFGFHDGEAAVAAGIHFE